MLTRRTGLIFTGTLDLVFEHHKSTKMLRQSIGMHCPMCTRLAQMLSEDTDISRDQPVAIRACLKKVHQLPQDPEGYDFTLDFKLGNGRECRFLLAKIGIALPTFHTMFTDTFRSQSSSSSSPRDVEQCLRDSTDMDEEM
jgi:hypothetical protein